MLPEGDEEGAKAEDDAEEEEDEEAEEEVLDDGEPGSGAEVEWADDEAEGEAEA